MKEIARVIYPDGKVAFEGEMEEGVLQGEGKLFFRETQKLHYEENWKENLPEGEGKVFFPNGVLWYDGHMAGTVANTPPLGQYKTSY